MKFPSLSMMKLPSIPLPVVSPETDRRVRRTGICLIVLAFILLGAAFLICIKKGHPNDNTWLINCSPDENSPLFSDVATAIYELRTKPVEHCRSHNLTTVIHCYGTACISRTEPNEEYRQMTIRLYERHPSLENGCSVYANWAKSIVMRKECLTADRKRVEGRVMGGNAGELWADVRVFNSALARHQ